MLREMVTKAPLLSCLNATERSIVVARLVRHEYTDGDIIVAQGERGDHFYLLTEGDVEVTSSGEASAGAGVGRNGRGDLARARMESMGGSADEKGEEVHRMLVPGDTFGELALLYSGVRTATCTARGGRVVCFALARQTFRAVVQKTAMERRRTNLRIINGCRLLMALKHYERTKLCDAMHPVDYAAGTHIIKQGDAASAAFHIIVKGEAAVVLADSPDEVLKTMEAGAYFGEVSLLADTPPTATVIAATDLRCLTIESSTFLRLVSSAERLFESKMDRYAFDASSPARRLSSRSKSMTSMMTSMSLNGGSPARADSERPVWPRVDPKTTPVLSELGSGCTACVYMCHLDRDGMGSHGVAMKAVTKKAIANHPKKFKQVVRETHALSVVRSPFVVHLEGKGQDDACLYLAIELADGGTVFEMLSSLWQAGRVLSIDAAKFYMAETVAAIEHVHRAGYVHRDIKPENILLDSMGHVLLSDFGFTKQLDLGDTTFTFCGTPDYLAPETLTNSGHGHGVDFWALGVLLYEMLCGVTPFQEDDEMKMYSRIMFSSVWFPDEFDPAAKSLVAGLLERDVTKRLGLMKGGIDDIKSHAFFEGVDWTAVNNRRMPPPYVPGPITPLSPAQRQVKRPNLSDLTEADTTLEYSKEHIAFFETF